MINTSGQKVKDIISKEFDYRVAMMVIQYLFDKGIENVQTITEEEILELKGNGIMTERFVQSLVRTAVKIANECNLIDEILPFIVMELHVPNAETNELVFYKGDLPDYVWEGILSDFYLEDEADEIERIDFSAVVTRTYLREV